MVADLEPRRARGRQVWPCAMVGDELRGARSVPARVQHVSEGEAGWPRCDTGEWLQVELNMDEGLMNWKLSEDPILGDALEEIETELGYDI